MKKLSVAVGILAVLAVALFTQKDRLVYSLMGNVMEQRLTTDVIAELDDGLHLAVCGAGGPMPAPNASGPCVVVIAGSRMFVVDAGTDGSRNLGRMGLPAGRIEAVFLSHYHSDHIDGLGEMAMTRWVAAANTAPLPVYGPSGLQKVVDGFNAAYTWDKGYRYAHHGDTVAPLSGSGMVAKEFVTPEVGVLETLISDGGLTIEALAVGHAPVTAAVGYRFSYKGRSLLITGDTVAMDNVREFAKGVDLLVHEALAPNLVNQMNTVANKVGNQVLTKITHDILDYHTSPLEAAQIAKDAGVGHLLYYHIVPPIVLPGQESLFLNGADEVFPDYTVGKDGVMFSLPAESNEIIQARKGL